MKSISITLAGKAYTVDQLPIKQSRLWRQQFAKPIEEILAALQVTSESLSSEMNNGADMGRLVGQLGKALLGGLGNTIIGSMDMLLVMVADYSPAIRADLERIENEAYDDEVVSAFLEVLKLAYPFSSLLRFATNGLQEPATK